MAVLGHSRVTQPGASEGMPPAAVAQHHVPPSCHCPSSGSS